MRPGSFNSALAYLNYTFGYYFVQLGICNDAHLGSNKASILWRQKSPLTSFSSHCRHRKNLVPVCVYNASDGYNETIISRSPHTLVSIRPNIRGHDRILDTKPGSRRSRLPPSHTNLCDSAFPKAPLNLGLRFAVSRWPLYRL